ncbi:PH domain-containing protein [Patescibacteria group bacterium]|nr:PH domain-containing protein [Patescibacteria group bacterium]
MSITTIVNPEETKKITFPGQYENEQILLVKRRHWIVLAGFILMIALLILVPIFVYFFLPLVFEIPNAKIFNKLFLFITCLYYLFLSVMSFFMIIDYYLDIWIITSQRILSVEQKGLFHRIVVEVRYSQIQDITSVVSGLVATYFQFGNINIQTAAEKERMMLKQITHPVETRRVISDAYHKEMEKTEEKKLV